MARYRRGEEEPCVSAIPRPRTLDRNRDAKRFASLQKGRDVVTPGRLIDVNGEEPTGFVAQKGVAADDVSPLEVTEDHLVRDGGEGLMRALGATNTRHVAHSPNPFVSTGRGAALLPRPRIRPEPREHVRSSTKQAAEECDLGGSVETAG